MAKEKKSKAKYTCPLKLQGLIERVNNLPAEDALPDSVTFEQAFVPTSSLYSGSYSRGTPVSLSADYQLPIATVSLTVSQRENLIDDLRHRFNQYFKNFSAKHRQNLKQKISSAVRRSPIEKRKEVEAAELKRAIFWAEDDRRMRRGLFRIAQALEIYREAWIESSDDELLEESFGLQLFVGAELYYDPLGEKSYYTSALGELVKDVDLDRIRICKHVKCNRLFWAQRFETEACPKCFDAYRQMRSRKLTPQEKEERQRRQVRIREKRELKKEKRKGK